MEALLISIIYLATTIAQSYMTFTKIRAYDAGVSDYNGRDRLIDILLLAGLVYVGCWVLL